MSNFLLRIAAILAATIAVALSSACSSSSDDSTSSPTTTAATGPATGATTGSTATICADYQALKDSLANLATLNVADVGIDGVQAALGDAAAKLATLKSDAEDQYAPEIAQLTQAFDQLRKTLSTAPSGDIGNTLKTIGSQLAAVGAAGQSLGSAIVTSCPSPTSS